MSWNYKAVRQNLRDMLNVGEFKFNVRKLDRNRYRFAVDLKASEPLASVELMNLEDEIAAAGAEKEYDAENNLIVRLALTAPPHASSREPGKIRVLNASSHRISANYLANVDPGAWKNLPDGVPAFKTIFISGRRRQSISFRYRKRMPERRSSNWISKIPTSGSSGFRSISWKRMEFMRLF